jgi:hypothetical protein
MASHFEHRSDAYWLLHQLRQAAPRRSLWRKATFETIRRAFLKIAVRIEELKSGVKIALPSAYPFRPTLMSLARPASPLNGPELGGECRRINPECQPSAALKIRFE